MNSSGDVAVAMAVDAFGYSESCCLLDHADYSTWRALVESRGFVVCITTVAEMMQRIDEEGDLPIH